MFNDFFGKGQDFFESKSCADTAREIAHQPEMWQKLSEYLTKVEPEIKNFMNKLGSLEKYRIILTGAGSSGFVGSAVAGFVAQNAGIHTEPIHTTSIVSAPETYLFAKIPTLLISFARSGNSPESVGAVEYAREVIKDLHEIAIVCDGTSKLADAAKKSKNGLVLVMPEGTNDKGFAMTSSVSCMILAGVASLMHNNIDKIAKDINLLAECMKKSFFEMAKSAASCAEWDFNRTWFLGSGPLTAITHEGSLKLMELTGGKVVAGHNNSAEFRHGPKFVLNPATVTIHFISSNEFTAKYDMDLLNELYGQKTENKIIALSKNQVTADANLKYKSDGFELITDVAVGMQGLVFMQLFAMYKSMALNVPTDNPSPSGLVNRVVQGVTVYPYKK